MFPVFAVDEQEDFVNQNSQAVETAVPESSEELNDNSTATVEEAFLQTQNVSDNGLKTPSNKKALIKKFIIAMLCVAGCSLFLYISLSLYNKIRDGFIVEDEMSADGEEPLEAPQDITKAVKTFVEKTHWNGV